MASKALWIGGGLAVALGGTVAVVLLSRDDEKTKGKRKGVDTSPPESPTPKGAADSDGVFRLEGEGLRQVTCDARNAKSGTELARVIRGLQEAVRVSGASKVDVRNTGLVDEVIDADAFNRELESGAKDVDGISGFFWPVAKAKVTSKLEGLPACDASPQTWEAIAAGTMQQAVSAESMPEPIWGLPQALAEAQPG